jgi:uncharacterized protein
MRTDAAAVVIAIAIAGCGTKGDSGSGGGASDRVKPGSATATGASAVDAAPPPPDAAPDAGVAPPVSAGERHVVAAGKDWPTVAGDVELGTGSRPFGATVVKPDAPGTWPAIVLMAGSGPTDRDWNNPLIQTRNGSGRLLANALARHGMVVIRFDKAGSGHNPGPPLTDWTLDTYTDEARLALAYLRGRADVRADAIFVAGHSEGGIHATRLAAKVGAQLRGVVLLSAAGRSMKDIIVGQITDQFADAHASPDEIAALMKPFTQALDDFAAGRAVDVEQASGIPAVRQLVKQIVRPDTAKLSRPLLVLDPAAAAAALPQRDFFVGGGGKDVQVSPDKDGKRLAAALEKAGKHVTFFVAPDADHVLKHEPHTIDEIRANRVAMQEAYNAPGRELDAAFVDALVAWLADVTAIRGP